MSAVVERNLINVNHTKLENNTRLSSSTNRSGGFISQNPALPPKEGGNVVANILNSFINTAQAGDSSNQGQNFDPNHKYYHYYELYNTICSMTNPSCTKDNVYQELKKFPAPGWDGTHTVKNHEISEIGFAGMGGQVRHIVDDKNHQVVNVTMPGHIFETGTVKRQIVENNNNVRVRTVGEGENESAFQTWLNMKTYRDGFKPFVEGFADLDAQIKSNFEGKFGK